MRPTVPLIERLFARVDVQEDGCWAFTGAKYLGYGVIGLGRRGAGTALTHRVAYKLLVGSLDDELTLDHLCRNRACLNPDHLEPVTLAENKRRGMSRNAINARKTHCVHGHPFDEANTYRNSTGGRECRACKRDRERMRRKRAAA